MRCAVSKPENKRKKRGKRRNINSCESHRKEESYVQQSRDRYELCGQGKENRRNVEDIPAIYVKGLTFHYVETIDEVLSYSLLSSKVSHPIDFTESIA